MRLLRGMLFPFLILFAWEVSARTGVLIYESLSYPSAILRAGIAAFADGSILIATWQTCVSALIGLAAGSVIGILLGSVLGLWPAAGRTAGPTFDALRAIPAVALMPLSLLLFGWGVSMEALVVAYACTWPVFIATGAAVRQGSRALV